LPDGPAVVPPLDAPSVAPFSTSPPPPPAPEADALPADEPALRPLTPTSLDRTEGDKGRPRRVPLLGRLFGRRPRAEAGGRPGTGEREEGEAGASRLSRSLLERPARD
jgi:hypothetical protein